MGVALDCSPGVAIGAPLVGATKETFSPAAPTRGALAATPGLPFAAEPLSGMGDV